MPRRPQRITPQRVALSISAQAPERLLTDDELAPLLGVTVSWLRKDRITRQQIPYVKLGDLPRYSLSRVLEALRQGERGGAK